MWCVSVRCVIRWGVGECAVMVGGVKAECFVLVLLISLCVIQLDGQ